MYQPPRRSPRYPFVATAEIRTGGSRLTTIARLKNLSLHGCFIHMGNPFPEGTAINIRIAVGLSVFEAEGMVVHCEPNAGAGVEFRTIEPNYLKVLEEWLLEAETLNIVEPSRATNNS